MSAKTFRFVLARDRKNGPVRFVREFPTARAAHAYVDRVRSNRADDDGFSIWASSSEVR